MKNDTNDIVFRHKKSENVKIGTFSIHTHNTYELIYFLGGNATHVIEDRKYKLKKGDLIIVRPYQHHFIQIDTAGYYERYNILFDPQIHGIESVSMLGRGVEVVSLEGNSYAAQIFKRMDEYRQRCDEETFQKLISHLISELFYAVCLFPQSAVETAPSVSPLISKALQFINANLCSITDIDEISSHLFVSQSYLFRLFKKELHKTPKKYIMEKRLYLAQQMIASGEGPTAIFRRCGFQDYTTFYRNYTAFFGQSPASK